MNTLSNISSNALIGRWKNILFSLIGLLPLIWFILFLVINIFFLVHYIKTIMERLSVILIITWFTSHMLPYVLVLPLLINVALFWNVNPKFINNNSWNNFNNKTSGITNFIIQTIKRVISTSFYWIQFWINNLKSIFVKSVKTS